MCQMQQRVHDDRINTHQARRTTATSTRSERASQAGSMPATQANSGRIYGYEMNGLPGWALLAMWAATLVGAYFLTKEICKRYGT
jgi:hypothetical protein